MRVPSLVLVLVSALVAAPAAATTEGAGAPGGLTLRSPWLEGSHVGTSWLPSFDEARRVLEELEDLQGGGAEAKQRSKKSSSAKSSSKRSSGNTLQYGALEGHVTPMHKQIGLGLQIGIPTAATASFFPIDQVGIVGGIGFGLGWLANLALSVFADVHWHPHVLVKADFFRLSWYVGAGLWMGFAPFDFFPQWYGPSYYFGFHYASYFRVPWFGTSLGLRLPFGLSIALNELPIEVYAEATPSFLVFPALGGGLGATVGLRFYL